MAIVIFTCLRNILGLNFRFHPYHLFSETYSREKGRFRNERFVGECLLICGVVCSMEAYIQDFTVCVINFALVS